MWRYVKSTSPSRSRAYSGSIGSLTLSRRSASSQASSTETIRAPARSYCSSGNALPSPAVVSTRTSCPRWTSSRAPAGVNATRYSSVLISFGTPIRTAREPYIFDRRVPTNVAESSQTRASVPGIVDLSGWRVLSPPKGGGGRSAWLKSSRPFFEIQQQARDRFSIFEFAEPTLELVHVPAHDLDVLIAFGMRVPALDDLRQENVHALVAEAGCRIERAQFGPTSPCEAHLLLEF